MTITIQKTGRGRAIATVNGRTFTATYDVAIKRWRVQTDSGEQLTTSPKMKSIAAVFQLVNVVGGSGRSGGPRVSRPRTSRIGRGRRATTVTGNGPVFTAPKVDPRNALLVLLSNAEDAMAQALAAPGAITQEKRDAYDKYKLLKTRALDRTAGAAAQNEAMVALRLALITAIKLTF